MMTTLAPIWNHYLLPVLDVLLLAFLFYRLLLFIKGTYAVQVIMGLLVLMVLTLVARDFLHLKATAWLLENFWSGAVILLAVVFQPELRGALAQLGSQPLGRILTSLPGNYIEEIVSAVAEASQRQMGILLVLEMDVGLRNYAETGTMINGEVSKELLMSIFHYRSPLHDGAVILQNGRVVAAGCLLPLSNDPHLAKILGTRHRAGVGLSEFTDAWVIIVSEETGTISIARGGQLEREITLDDLRDRLTSLYHARRSKTDGLAVRKKSE